MSGQSVAEGRYRLERPLGHGGMAAVYLAWDSELDRPVAVKLLAENLADDPAFRARFVREAVLAARLSHPNVVGVYDAGEEDGRPYIVMEQVDGETLAELLARRGPLPPDEARGLAVQACRGLQHAHAAGLVHRDVKPQNLLLRKDGVLKIADFGIARAAEGTALTQTGTVLGTAAYMAPELLSGGEVTPAADVYSLGAVLYELLAGRPPHEPATLAALAQPDAITPVGELAPRVPPRLEDTVMRCLARNPAYRPADARALLDELDGGSETVEAPTVPLAQPTSKPARSGPNRKVVLGLVAALVLAAAIAIAASLVALSGGDAQPPVVRQPTVQPVQPGADARQQARNLGAWIRQYSR